MTVCPEPGCGYNLPHHDPACPAAPRRVFYCADHAPAGATPLPYDDGRPTCATCRRAHGGVKPYAVEASR